MPELLSWVDGVCQEPYLFTGSAGVAWDDPAAGDVVVPAETTATWTRRLKRFKGKLVLTLDYCLDPAKARTAVARSRAHGFVPFVTRTPLDRLPD